MANSNFINIHAVSDGYESLVKEDLKFKTGKFVWQIKFNIPLNPITVNNKNLTVFDESSKPVKTRITYNETFNYIEVEPLETYLQGSNYTLLVSKNVESRGGQRLKKDISLQFEL